jgi:hypothetical protein
MLRAPRELFGHANMLRHVSRDISAVKTVHGVRPQLSGRQKRHERIGEQEIGICRHDEFSPRSTNTDILCDHLKQWDRISVPNGQVRLGGDLDDTNWKRVRLGPGLENFIQPGPRRGIPLDDDQFPENPVTVRLLEEAVGEDTEPS